MTREEIMERRIGLAVAGAISMVVLAGTLALGANLGVFGSEDGSIVESGAIESTAVAEDAPVVTVEVRDPSGRLLGTSTSGSVALPQPGSVSSQSFSSSDDPDHDSDDHSGHGGGGDDDEDEDDDHSGHGGGGDDDDKDDDDD
jgi:hypothetical protein